MNAQWIAVADRLPEEDADVLLFWDASLPMDVGYFCGYDSLGQVWCRANEAMKQYDAEPTHWMTLPEVPQ